MSANQVDDLCVLMVGASVYQRPLFRPLPASGASGAIRKNIDSANARRMSRENRPRRLISYAFILACIVCSMMNLCDIDFCEQTSAGLARVKVKSQSQLVSSTPPPPLCVSVFVQTVERRFLFASPVTRTHIIIGSNGDSNALL